MSAIDIEQNKIKENVGSQDQTIASYGGLNKINFSKNKKIIVNKILMKDSNFKKFNESLVLFFTGFSRKFFRCNQILFKKYKK